jgi:hypothetical protein
MADPTGGLPSGVDPSDPGMSNDSSLGADRGAAIEAEKKKWRDTQARKAKEPAVGPDNVVPARVEQDFDE